MRFQPFSFALLFTLTIAIPLIAHDTWLAPNRFHTPQPGSMRLALSSGMGFPNLDHAIAGDRVELARWRSARGAGSLPAGTSGAHALELRGDTASGVTVFWIVLHPRPSKLKREQVREYVHHLGIPNAGPVFAEWESGSKAEETGYRYMKYAKTFVRTGAADDSGIWAEPAGMRLELVPQNDPTSVVSLGALTVLLLDQGKPLARHPVALLHEGAKDPIAAVTDAQGRVRLALPASGRYMLRATTLEPSANEASAWDVRFTTMTFEVAPVR